MYVCVCVDCTCMMDAIIQAIVEAATVVGTLTGQPILMVVW